jgi:membrane-associated phospholipid phosphatase
MLLLASFLIVAFSRNNFSSINLNINSWIATIQNNSFTIVAEGIDIIFDTNSLLLISLAVAALLIIRKNLRGAVLLLAAMAGDALLVEIAKSFFHTSRPPNMLVHKLGYGFPSGHATGSVVFFGILTFLIWQHWNSAKVKVATSLLYVTAIVLIGFDRIYLNVHWFCDVIGGYLLGAFWLTLVLFIFFYAKKSSPHRP